MDPLPLRAAAGTEGASFLDIPVGAGPAALGSAYAALATNAYAPTSNPGGLGFLKGTELAAQHLAYVQDIRYEHFGFVVPFAHREGSPIHRGLGVSVQDVGTGDIARTDVLNGAPVTNLGSFSSHWGAYSLSYGQTVTDSLAFGVTGKWIQASIDDVSASAYAFDVGSLYRWTDKLSVAATVVNVGSKLKFLSSGDSLPMAIHAGMAYRLSAQWLMTTEVVGRKTELYSAHFGAQWEPIPAISLRAGYKTDTTKGLSALAGFTTGIGIQMWGHELAYAWVPYAELGHAQYLSFLMRFGSQKSSRRNLIQSPVQKRQRVARAEREDRGEGDLLDDFVSDPKFAQLLLEAPVVSPYAK